MSQTTKSIVLFFFAFIFFNNISLFASTELPQRQAEELIEADTGEPDRAAELNTCHGDHLSSTGYVTDANGEIVEHLSYFPYGETWVQEKSSLPIAYQFTAKELDEETGYYYFGARYYDPRTSVWVSTDPALVSYLPTRDQLSSKDEPFDPGMLRGNGGVYNSINGNLYQYAKRNPLRFIDPDGKIDIDSWQTRFVVNIMNAFGGNDNANQMATMQSGQLGTALNNSPLSPSFYGLSMRAFVGVQSPVKIPGLDISAKATLDASGNVDVSMNIGVKRGDMKAGVNISGTIMQNGEFKLKGNPATLGLDRKMKDNVKAILRDMGDTDKYEVGVAIGQGAGVEVRWNPATLLKNLTKDSD